MQGAYSRDSGPDDGRLAGKVAVITGTAGGQGRAAALRFAREGALVVGCDFKADGANETVAMVRAAGGEMTSAQPLDLADEDQVQQLMRLAVDTYGGIDIVYNNAGALRTGLVGSMSREDFDYTITNEVTLLWLAVKHALPGFRARGGGTVINIGSISGMIGAGTADNAPGLFAHSVAKGAVIRMGSHLAVELAPMNVRVNTISPGIIDTPTTIDMLGEEGSDIRATFLRHLLVRRIGRSEDIVNAAVFLASDEAGYITGVNLPVDGGWTGSGGMGQPSEELSWAGGELGGRSSASV